jgi:hypothetical protein
MNQTTVTLKRVDPMSAGKLGGALYAVLGLIAGALISLGSLLGRAEGSAPTRPWSALMGTAIGLGAVIILPILYGVLGFVGTALMAAVYNWLARMIGGVQWVMELSAKDSLVSSAQGTPPPIPPM